jgi:tetratricopeptide (TPR) repeat protein
MVSTLTLIRAAGILLTAAVLGGVMHCAVWVPYRLNLEKKVVADDMLVIQKNPETVRARMYAKRNIQRLSSPARCYGDAELHNYRGMNHEILRQDHLALAAYELALTYDERPELYSNLSRVQLRLGRPDEAIDSLVRALRFSPLVYVPEPLKPEVEERLQRQ